VIAVSVPIKWDIARRIIEVLISRYSHMLPPATVIELYNSVTNMDANAFVERLYRCVETLAYNGIEDQDIERLMNDLFVSNYFIFFRGLI
jgi:hypothetical protein